MRGVAAKNKVSEENKVSEKNRIRETVLLDCFLIVVLATLSYYTGSVMPRYITIIPCFGLIVLTITGVARVYCDVDEIPRMLV